MTDQAKSNEVMENYQAPGWLRETLQAASMPAELRHRCEQAALRAYDVARLRTAREQTGFVAIPLTQWFMGLAQMAGVELAPVVEWFGGPDLSRPTLETAGAISRLARAVGFQLRETLLLLRTTVAYAAGNAAIPLLVAARRGEASDAHSEAEEALADIEALYDGERSLALQAILDSAERQYADTP